LRACAYLFDLDGTLVDTEALWTYAIVEMVNSRGGSATAEQLLPDVIGRCWIDIDRALHRRFPEIGESTLEEDAEQLRENFQRYVASGKKPEIIKGTVEFFRKAAALAPCAIVSGSPRHDVVAAAEMCGISDKVSLVLGAGDYAEGKPSPSGYLKAAELLGVEPSDCVVIEDSSVGVRAGVAAGMKVLALDRRTDVPQDFSAASWRFQDLSGVSPEDLV
jgi:HAD superfamily hydrolase (TIGR01509 family)